MSDWWNVISVFSSDRVYIVSVYFANLFMLGEEYESHCKRHVWVANFRIQSIININQAYLKHNKYDMIKHYTRFNHKFNNIIT